MKEKCKHYFVFGMLINCEKNNYGHIINPQFVESPVKDYRKN